MSFEEMSENEILKIANPIMDRLMQASTEINYERHIKDFTFRLKNIITKEYFQEVCDEYQADKGFFSERTHVAVFKRPDSVAIVWVQFFTKTQGEFVAEMVLVNQDGMYLVDHVVVF